MAHLELHEPDQLLCDRMSRTNTRRRPSAGIAWWSSRAIRAWASLGLFHDWRQIPRDLADIIKSAGVNYHLYPSSKHTYKSLLEEIEPHYLKEAMATPRYHAINVIRSGGVVVPPFIARMLQPSTLRLKSAAPKEPENGPVHKR